MSGLSGMADAREVKADITRLGDKLFYRPDDCSVGGVNWPLCALRISEHRECRERREAVS